MSEIKGFVSKEEHLSIRKQCDLLEIARSNIYYEPVQESDENLKIMREMDQEFLDYPTHGVLQMRDFLITLGIVANHKRVRRLLRLMGVMAIYPKKNLSKLGQAKYIRPYLLKGLKIDRANQVWEIDITYIPMPKGFMYLCAIIDVYSRYVVGWSLSNNLAAENSLEVLKGAIQQHGQPEIINSDQGSQFTCSLWTEYVENELEGVKLSMDGKGRAIDNIFIERFWRTLKRDYVYLYPQENGLDLHKGIKKFIDYYNHKKTHQGIGHRIPYYLYAQIA